MVQRWCGPVPEECEEYHSGKKGWSEEELRDRLAEVYAEKLDAYPLPLLRGTTF